QQLSTNIHQIIQFQLENLKILPHVFPLTATLELPQDQYNALSTITTYMGKADGTRWPYFFITGPAGTGKSYIIHLIIKMLNQRRSNYLLLAPTGVAAQNIGGRTIHSELQLTSTQSGFTSKAFTNMELKTHLQRIDTLIIEEISMVSAELLDYISNLFARLHNNAIAFGEIK
ncbi:3429_t:CDS:1, partial [Cetraspora pellucida]